MAKSVQSKIKSSAKKTAKKVAKKHPVLTFFVLIIFALCVIGGYYAYNKFFKPSPAPITGELSVHFMMLGNDHSGDAIYIKAGDNDILIDAGSETSSVTSIRNYVDQYCTDGVLEYVIATHADADHIAGFAGTTKQNTSIFDYYETKIIIDFPITEKTTDTYNRYVAKRDAEVAEGAKHFTALECYNQTKEGALKEYALTDSVTMKILYNYFYEHDASSENNYSVCIMFTHGDRNFLFTGDLQKTGEEYLVSYNNLSEVDFYKAGHHGSSTSSTTKLLEKIKPKIVVIPCCAAEPEFGDGYGFPHQEVINNISEYTDKVYAVSTCDPAFTNGAEYVGLNGNIVVTSNETEISVSCSVSNTVLKDTEWFKANRETPPAWN